MTPDELLAMLERRELGLRRRLEQIIDEMGEMRDSVSRVKRAAAGARGAAPEDNHGNRKCRPGEPRRRPERNAADGRRAGTVTALAAHPAGRGPDARNRPRKSSGWLPLSTTSAKN